ncbi:hypothetical protein MYCTH_2109230 [Thermothelomyces thermophilus ATCC 42464]|uniref:Uncharacterized protein n=1 Tax=Thermothelomyces thermophilus (strain ATCC 42464 / BCRC 31852 / DSM 1799) TaxID=573729 RepID=G2QAV4_THET4|nr:uncharacterized protein MYCTH_2109230 [Thermothelomyces thermophilus ATCC 42464]AEO56746.1 hypothetical protein MYCTH_2109230 [Thermothelomyces thermophilus ATCC 42464]
MQVFLCRDLGPQAACPSPSSRTGVIHPVCKCGQSILRSTPVDLVSIGGPPREQSSTPSARTLRGLADASHVWATFKLAAAPGQTSNHPSANEWQGKPLYRGGSTRVHDHTLLVDSGHSFNPSPSPRKMEEIISTFKYVPRTPALGDALPIDQPDRLSSSFSSVPFSLDLVDPRIIGVHPVQGSKSKCTPLLRMGVYPRHRPTCTAQSLPLAPQKPGTGVAMDIPSWAAFSVPNKIPALGVEGLLPNDTSKCAF